MLTVSFVKRIAKIALPVVGIGMTGKNRNVRESAIMAQKARWARQVIEFNNPRELVFALYNRDIDCAVRGNLSAVSTIAELKKSYGVQSLARVAVMVRPSCNSLRILAPVGIDEGNNMWDRLELAMLSAKLIKLFGSRPTLGLLSAGRPEDADRNPAISKSLQAATILLQHIRTKGVSARLYGIEIENAADKVNCILAPDGTIGNFIFRSLHYLGGWGALGAPALSLLNQNAIYIDTSRRKSDFQGAIALAAALKYLVCEKQ